MARTTRQRASAALLLATLTATGLAGCVGTEDAAHGSTHPPRATTPLENATAVFEPPFALTAPTIVVRGPAVPDTNANVTLSAEWPAGSGVDATKIATYVWAFGDGEEGVGASLAHHYEVPGRFDVEVRVEDVYGRTATASAAVGIADNRTETGVIAVGNGARDTVPFSPGASAYDHRDYDLALEPSASGATFTLRFERKPGVQGQLVPAEANNLVLKILDSSGTVLASAAGASNPKTLALDATALSGTMITLRVSGDAGLQVPYTVASLVTYGGAEP